MTELRWEPMEGVVEGEEAYSGSLLIGSILHRTTEPSSWIYHLDAIQTKGTKGGYGEVADRAAARQAVAIAWTAWCEEAGAVIRAKGVDWKSIADLPDDRRDGRNLLLWDDRGEPWIGRWYHDRIDGEVWGWADAREMHKRITPRFWADIDTPT